MLVAVHHLQRVYEPLRSPRLSQPLSILRSGFLWSLRSVLLVSCGDVRT
uniref:Uncharacterized protein n=1 Tax=Arundo donax TaxID=35708 RepID=A0A0A8YI93_ARUDO